MSKAPDDPKPIGTQTPLHYRLTTEEWLEINQRLKPAEVRVLYYLRTLDPFGDRALNLKVIEIAEATALKKGTVSKALKVLDSEGFIDLEMVTVRIQVQKFPTENQVSPRKHRSTVGNIAAQEETSQHGRKPDCTPGNFQEPEAAPQADSRSPHTIHTDQPLQTLSNSTQTPEPERERERNADAPEGGEALDPIFRAWLTAKAKRLPRPPELLERWIEVQAQRPSIQEEFKASREAVNGTNVPPPREVKDFEVEAACFSALQAGDRAWVRSKLDGLCLSGWRELVRELLSKWPQWAFCVEGDRVVEVVP